MTAQVLHLFPEMEPRPAPRYERHVQHAPAHTLRDYQHKCVDAVHASLREHRSCLVVMATGLGKSTVGAAIVRDRDGRALWLAHRDELIAQARAEIESMTGTPCAIEKSHQFSQPTDRLVVGSMQTVARPDRMKEMGDFDTIVVDEAHRAVCKSYRDILAFWPDAKVVGLTATPDRGDEVALGLEFKDVAFAMDITVGIDAGWLVPVRAQRVVVEEIDLSDVGKDSFGDLQAGKLDEAMVKAVEGIVAETLRREPDRQGICFFPGVQSAELAAQVFNRYQPESAVCVSGETETMLRRRVMEDFKAGRIKYLCNCNVATEGFDAPSASLIVQGRPTLSRALYAQMAGRGTRPAPGCVYNVDTAAERRAAIAASAKPDMMILDFVGNTDHLDLVSSVDILGGDYTPAEVKAAKVKEKLEGGAEMNPAAMLEAARREIAAMAVRMRASVKSRAWEVNPFKTIGITRESVSFLDTRYGFQPMTDKQRAGLLRLGFSERELEGVGKRGANALYNKVGERIDQRLASFKQLRAIRKHYPVGDDVGFSRASEALNYIASSGWRPDGARLEAILGAPREPGED